MFVAITDNGGGPRNIYHDIAGEVYTFPKSSRNLLVPGTKVIYHRAAQRRKEDLIPGSMTEQSHYFGTAEIGKVSMTPDGNYRAEILNYEIFKYPVYIHRPDGEYYEKAGNFRRGVRKIDQDTYESIRGASLVAPINPIIRNSKKKIGKSKGVKSFTSIIVHSQSDSFLINGKSYRVVTGKNGFYIESPDKIYYEIRKIEGFELESRHPLSISISSSGSVLVKHNEKGVFILSPIINGVKATYLPTNDIISVHM